MTTKRILIFAPLVLTLILLQSYFWVPTYEQQEKGNPDRLSQYINASIGDAAILIPILSADSASSEIEGKVLRVLLTAMKNLISGGGWPNPGKFLKKPIFISTPRPKYPTAAV